MGASRILWLAPLVVAAACGNSSSPSGAAPALTETPSASPSAAPSTPPAASPSTGGAAACQASSLSLQLAAGGAAAGSVYRPLVFTNKGSSPCTLYGYPGVAFVAPGSGQQVGTAAGRNPMHPSSTVLLNPGSSASALLQIPHTENYSPSDCQPKPVSGIRVYAPGSTVAAYVAFSTTQNECSSSVSQLSVTAVVAGTAG